MNIADILAPRLTINPELVHGDRIRAVLRLAGPRQECVGLIGPLTDDTREECATRRILRMMRSQPDREFSSADFEHIGVKMRPASTMIHRLYDEGLIYRTARAGDPHTVGRRRRWYRAVMPTTELIHDFADADDLATA